MRPGKQNIQHCWRIMIDSFRSKNLKKKVAMACATITFPIFERTSIVTGIGTRLTYALRMLK